MQQTVHANCQGSVRDKERSGDCRICTQAKAAIKCQPETDKEREQQDAHGKAAKHQSETTKRGVRYYKEERTGGRIFSVSVSQRLQRGKEVAGCSVQQLRAIQRLTKNRGQTAAW